MKIVVIGSGIAGLNFSLKAARKGHKVTIVTKKAILESATNYAQGGIAAVLSQTDDFQKHIDDTLKAGVYHNKKSAVAMMVKRASSVIHELIELGVPFATHHGKLLLTREGGHSERRIAFVGDYTGQEIELALAKKVREEKNIKILEHTLATDLLVENGICYGVQIFQHVSGFFRHIFSDQTVVASGGLGQIYAYTTNPKISTGDGYAMGFRAGAKLRDMEFIQFHPTTFRLKGGRPFLITEALRGEGAYLLNEKGVRFMKAIHPLAELAPRDIVARAIFQKLQTGNVYLDLRHLEEEKIHARFPKITEILKKNGYRITNDLIPIFPAAHYCCGGLETDLAGRVKLLQKTRQKHFVFCRGLYAFGEVAWTGVHGANRLASNSLLEALVFSDQILQAKEQSRIKLFAQMKHVLLRKYRKPKAIPLSSPILPYLAHLERILKKTIWEHGGIVRTKKGLQTARKILSELHGKILSLLQKGFHEKLWELRNMSETSLLVIEAALKRKKSLGCHYRKN